MGTSADIAGVASIARHLPTDDYVVDGWLVQPTLNRLARDTRAIRIRPQLMDVLTCLAQRPGAVVSKDELLATVWSDRFVAESGIARCVAELRQLLADDARQPRVIETIPKRGYRLIAPVRPVAERDSGESDAAEADLAEPVMSDAKAAIFLAALAGLVRRFVA
jgi:DNA-binding winged helix-turn-helix (wHTH) protein